jgi:hypothetical protein
MLRVSVTSVFLRYFRISVITNKLPGGGLMLCLHNGYINHMETTAKKSTIYFDPRIHKALRLKAAETDSSVSDIVNEAIRIVLAEDAEDFAAFAERAHEPNLSLRKYSKTQEIGHRRDVYK